MPKPIITITTLADLASAVPSILGFYPERSVVLCVVSNEGLLGPVARIDWNDDTDGHLLILDTLTKVRDYGTPTAFTFGLDSLEADSAFQLLEEFVEGFGRVNDGDCIDLRTLEVENVSPYSPVVTELVGLGQTSGYGSTREELTQSVAFSPDWRSEVDDGIDAVGDVPMLPSHLVSYLTSGSDLGPATTARVLIALTDPSARDSVWAAVTQETARPMSRQFASLLRAVEGEEEVESWIALAMATAYASGNGGLVNVMCERPDVAGVIARGSGLPSTLDRVFQNAMHPEVLLGLIAEMTSNLN